MNLVDEHSAKDVGLSEKKSSYIENNSGDGVIAKRKKLLQESPGNIASLLSTIRASISINEYFTAIYEIRKFLLNHCYFLSKIKE